MHGKDKHRYISMDVACVCSPLVCELDREGEAVHAELPEDAPTQQPLFH